MFFWITRVFWNNAWLNPKLKKNIQFSLFIMMKTFVSLWASICVKYYNYFYGGRGRTDRGKYSTIFNKSISQIAQFEPAVHCLGLGRSSAVIACQEVIGSTIVSFNNGSTYNSSVILKKTAVEGKIQEL